MPATIFRPHTVICIILNENSFSLWLTSKNENGKERKCKEKNMYSRKNGSEESYSFIILLFGCNRLNSFSFLELIFCDLMCIRCLQVLKKTKNFVWKPNENSGNSFWLRPSWVQIGILCRMHTTKKVFFRRKKTEIYTLFHYFICVYQFGALGVESRFDIKIHSEREQNFNSILLMELKWRIRGSEKWIVWKWYWNNHLPSNLKNW